MIDWSDASSSGCSRSSAIFSPSFGRRAVDQRGGQARDRVAQHRIEGRTKPGIDAPLQLQQPQRRIADQFRSAEPALEGGTGRLVFEPNTFLCITTLSTRGSEVAQGTNTGQEEVGAAQHGDELRQAA